MTATIKRHAGHGHDVEIRYQRTPSEDAYTVRVEGPESFAGQRDMVSRQAHRAVEIALVKMAELDGSDGV